MAKEEKKLQSFNSFNGGEYSPDLAGRVDLQSFGSSARFLSNFMPEVTGGIKKFYGTRHIAEIEKADMLRLIPFNNRFEPMCLVFTSKSVGLIASEKYSKLNIQPLPTQNLSNVRWKQINDKIVFVSEDMPVTALDFLGEDPAGGGYVFRISQQQMTDVPYFPIGWDGNYNGEIEITGVTDIVKVRATNSGSNIKIDFPDMFKGVTQVNIFGPGNYLNPKRTANGVVLGTVAASRATLIKDSSGVRTDVATGIVSGEVLFGGRGNRNNEGWYRYITRDAILGVVQTVHPDAYISGDQIIIPGKPEGWTDSDSYILRITTGNSWV